MLLSIRWALGVKRLGVFISSVRMCKKFSGACLDPCLYANDTVKSLSLKELILAGVSQSTAACQSRDALILPGQNNPKFLMESAGGLET